MLYITVTTCRRQIKTHNAMPVNFPLLEEHSNLSDHHPLPLRLRDDDGDALDVNGNVKRLLKTSVPEFSHIMRVRTQSLAVQQPDVRPLADFHSGVPDCVSTTASSALDVEKKKEKKRQQYNLVK